MKASYAPVVELSVADISEYFTYEEWVCIRLIWFETGQRIGPNGELASLFTEPGGELGDVGLVLLREMVEQCRHATGGRDALLEREVSFVGVFTDEVVGLQCIEEFWALIKQWGVPYRHKSIRADNIKRANKKVCDYGAFGAPRIPRMRDLSAFRSAFCKLEQLLASSITHVAHRKIGPVYLHENH